MAEKIYNWTDDPMVSGVADCNTDVVNDCLMHLKYENTSDAIQNMYETGQVEKQSRAFNQLLSMKRSTFDKSKFTIVGSPTITDDGVVSGFSNSNYITVQYNLKENSVYSFTISGIAGSPNTARGQYLFNARYSEATRYGLRVIVTAKTNIIRFALGADYGDVFTNITLKENQKYVLTVTTDFKTFATVKDELTGYTKTKSDYVITNQLYGNKLLEIGNIVNENAPLVNGSIDLKQFSITVDGKEVFNGNETGIDTIKADNYEVVGSPVISDDGVITTSVGINTYKDSVRSQSITLSNSKKFCIFCKLPKRALGDIYRVLRLQQTGTTDNNNYNFNLEARRDIGSSGVGYRFVYFVTENNVRSVKTLDFQIPEILNQDVSVKIEYSAEQNTIRIYKYINNQEILITSRTLTAPLNYIDEYGYLHIGMTQGYSINLNSFKIYVDGNLVYQPCLKIPYTQSKTGSKIVDVAYRDRVQDLYEQEGLAGYYTIDEENQNFTLPMGEIYGMIEQAKSSVDGKVSKSGDTMTGQLHINDLCRINHVPKLSDSDSTATPLVLIQKKASDFGANTYGNILFQNTNGEDVGIIGGVENADGSHRIRFVIKNGSNWTEMPQIIDSYWNGKSGYNIYSSGYCEQCGWIGAGTGTSSVRYNFLKPFANDNFNITYSIASNDAHTRWANQMSLNGWDVNGFNAMNVGGFGAYWCARGYV